VGSAGLTLVAGVRHLDPQRAVPVAAQTAASHNDYVSPIAALALVVALVALGVLAVLVVGRRFADKGYRVNGEVFVRCREGHLFTTIWIPGMSLKAVRLGWIRWQYCPVGEHMTFVVPVRDADLTDRERWIARQYRDTRIP
jgi:hypothetical protein